VAWNTGERKNEIKKFKKQVKEEGYTRSPFTRNERALTRPFVKWFNRKVRKCANAVRTTGSNLAGKIFWGELKDGDVSWKEFPKIAVEVNYKKNKVFSIPYINRSTDQIHYRPVRRVGVQLGSQYKFDGFWEKNKKGEQVPIKLGWALYDGFQGQKGVCITQYIEGEEVKFACLDIPSFKSVQEFYKFWKKQTELGSWINFHDDSTESAYSNYSWAIETTGNPFKGTYTDAFFRQKFLDATNANCVFSEILKSYEKDFERKSKEIQPKIDELAEQIERLKMENNEEWRALTKCKHNTGEPIRKLKSSLKKVQEYLEIYKEGLPYADIPKVCEDLKIRINVVSLLPVDKTKVALNADIMDLKIERNKYQRTLENIRLAKCCLLWDWDGFDFGEHIELIHPEYLSVKEETLTDQVRMLEMKIDQLEANNFRSPILKNQLIAHGSPKVYSKGSGGYNKVFNFWNTRSNHLEIAPQKLLNWFPAFKYLKRDDAILEDEEERKKQDNLRKKIEKKEKKQRGERVDEDEDTDDEDEVKNVYEIDLSHLHKIENYLKKTGQDVPLVIKNGGLFYESIMKGYDLTAFVKRGGRITKLFTPNGIYCGTRNQAYALFCERMKIHAFDMIANPDVHDLVLSACICPTQSFLDRGTKEIIGSKHFQRRGFQYGGGLERYWLPVEARYMDMRKAFANCSFSKYYDGYMGKIWQMGQVADGKPFSYRKDTCYIYGLTFDGFEGLPFKVKRWIADLNLNLPSHHDAPCGFPDSCLPFFDEVGLKYKCSWFVAGQRICANEELFPDEMKNDGMKPSSYATWTGIQVSKQTNNEFWFVGNENYKEVMESCLDPSIQLDTLATHPNLIKATLPKQSAYVCPQVVAYIYSYCWMDTFTQLLKFKRGDDVWRINADAIIFNKNALGLDDNPIQFDDKRYREEFRDCPRNCWDAWDEEMCEVCRKLGNVRITETKYVLDRSKKSCMRYSPCSACASNHKTLNAFENEIEVWVSKSPELDGGDFQAYYEIDIPKFPELGECIQKIPDSRWKQNGLSPEWVPFHQPTFNYKRLPVFRTFSKYDLYCGIGGGGKSYGLVVLNNKSLANPLFITKTHALNADMRKTAKENGIDLDTLTLEATIRRSLKPCGMDECENCKARRADCIMGKKWKSCGVCKVCKKHKCPNPVVGMTPNQERRFDWINSHGIILFDESPQYPTKIWKRIEELFPSHKIIYLGDPQHQLPPFPSAKEEIIIDEFWGDVYKFTDQYRAKTQTLKDINTELRGIVDDIWEEKKTHRDLVERLKEIFQHQTLSYEEMKRHFTDNDIIINSVNDKKDKNTKDLPHIQIHRVEVAGDGYFVGNILHGTLPSCFQTEEGQTKVVRQVAHTSHAYQGQTFKGRRLFIDLNGMETNGGDCHKYSRMIEMCVGRCQNENQVWITRSPHKYDVLGTGYLYRIANTKTGHYYLGSSFSVNARFKQHRGDFQKNKHECESFVVYEKGQDCVEEEVLSKTTYCFRCKCCKGCQKDGVCEDWEEDLLKKEGELISLNRNNPLCVNKEIPYKNYIQAQ